MCQFATQVLQDKYSGFVGREIVDDYVNYADVLFENFGDLVKDWMTFNEPWITCTLQVSGVVGGMVVMVVVVVVVEDTHNFTWHLDTAHAAAISAVQTHARRCAAAWGCA